ncbi:SO_0444 family Cu/Zn efflux transporter [Thioalkalivibrio sp. ALJ3]|uniref:SO_0444 family Cu/Zn efflux transporter n=1 Tax=Thioalkalivibrio sp. ALJ3 TaxID=1240557 RepID=UPI00035EA707|nr:SO_0444 family Cu/Zn efflux transporter [Thioalkalivibrio sp. ALJ3]
MIAEILSATLELALTAAPWLLLGLAAAGLVKAFLPEAALQRWLGGTGLAPTARAAIAGAPLPLCSCGAIPTALALHRGGAGRGPTTAFLIGTPGVGVDSVAISYALLGPLMTVARVAGALVTAITTGLLVGRTRAPEAHADDTRTPQDCCTASSCDEVSAPATAAPGPWTRLLKGQRYAFGDVLDDIRLWLVIGLFVAGALLALVPPAALAEYGSGLPVMLLLAVIGIPMYLCATAATPIAVALLAAGVSPGAVLVFLLAAPITSLATLGVFRRELGNAALSLYLLGIGASTIALGLILDAGLGITGLSPGITPGQATEWIPPAVEWAALVVLVGLALHPLRWPLTRSRDVQPFDRTR